MSVNAAHFERKTELAPEVTDERVDRAIHEIELGLAKDDPTFVRRVRRPACRSHQHDHRRRVARHRRGPPRRRPSDLFVVRLDGWRIVFRSRLPP